jgi:hypothetical protein
MNADALCGHSGTVLYVACTQQDSSTPEEPNCVCQFACKPQLLVVWQMRDSCMCTYASCQSTSANEAALPALLSYCPTLLSPDSAVTAPVIAVPG